jgi:hypothetical protein
LYPAALGLKIQDLASQNVSLQEVTKVQISELKATNPSLKLLESISTTLAGKPNLVIGEFSAPIWIDRDRIIEIVRETVSKYITVLEVISVSRFDD